MKYWTSFLNSFLHVFGSLKIRASTKKALGELISSPDFSECVVAHADRITLTPNRDASDQIKIYTSLAQVWTPSVIMLLEAFLTVQQFGLLLIHAYAQDKRWPYMSLPFDRSERPENWVQEEPAICKSDVNVSDDYSEIFHVDEYENKSVVNIFPIHSENWSDGVYQNVPGNDPTECSNEHPNRKVHIEEPDVLSVWKQQFVDAVMLKLIPS